ncbi:aldehyde dehydrogenase family protein, partial [Chromobacterium aquaticum]
MSENYSVITPLDGSTLLQRGYTSPVQTQAALDAARVAQAGWRATPLAERKALIGRAVDWLIAHKSDCADAITRQIGRPIRQSPGEIGGLAERARHMLDIAEEA